MEDILNALDRQSTGRLEEPENMVGRRGNRRTIQEWCEWRVVSGLREGIDKGARVMSHIVGFETGLEDEELQDKHTGSADAIYLGVIPKQLESSVKRYIKEALSCGRAFRKAGPMIEKAEHLWVKVK